MPPGVPRPHGALLDQSDTGPALPSIVEGVCVSIDDGTNTAMVVIPGFSPDHVWGPCPFVQIAGKPLVVGSRCVIVFAAAPHGRLPWVVSWVPDVA